MSESNFYFIPSKIEGKKMLVYENYLFTKDRTLSGRSYWKCTNKQCKCRAVLHDERTVNLKHEHTHPPDSVGLARKKIRVRVRQRVRQNGLLYPITKLYKEETAKAVKELCVTDEMSPLVTPSFDSIKSTLYKERKKASVSLVPTEDFDKHSLSLDDILLPNFATGIIVLCVSTIASRITNLHFTADYVRTVTEIANVGHSSFALLRKIVLCVSTIASRITNLHFTADYVRTVTEIANVGHSSFALLRKTRKGLLERLKDNVVIGDGGFVFSLEKRGYVKAGPWTPEAAVEHPEAVRNLHREFLRAGSDVMQAFTFYASDDKLINRGNDAGKRWTGADINQAACKIAREVADEGDALVAGGISQTPTYLSNKGKDAVQAEFRKQVEVFVANNVDFLICEYFEHIEEMEWAIQVCKETNLPVAATMCIGSEGDLHDVAAGECAVRMAKAGADVVGLNCHFDPFMTLDTIAIMKKALDAQGLKPYLMTQPLGFFTPDAGKQGFIDLPEFPFALEPRVCTRWDMQRYARQAYDLGVRYIGGCCGFESYHIRAVSEELANERGKYPESSKKHDPWGEGLKMHTKPWVRARACKEYWQNMNPSTGRPFSITAQVFHLPCPA